MLAAPDEPARRALGAFLRRMRDRATPEAGTRRAPRRRAAGLRREEVAVAAGISVTWYTWLEQGRAVRVSRRTLQSIARALRLDATERAHLLRLAVAATSARPAARRLTTRASTTLARFVDALAPHPAYAVNGRWDVLHANAAAVATFGAFDARPGVTDNVLRRLFLDAGWRERFEQWDAIAASAVAQFRAATAPMVGDPALDAFVGGLLAESDAFAAAWARHDLADADQRAKVVRHPGLGRLSLLYVPVTPEGEPADVRVIVYVPADAATALRLAAPARK